MKFTWMLHIEFIPTIFPLMINYFNKLTFDFYAFHCCAVRYLPLLFSFKEV